MMWQFIRGLMGLAGFICIFLGVSTSDYYVMELRQDEPAYVWWTIGIGLALMIPAIAFSIYDELKERDDVQD